MEFKPTHVCMHCDEEIMLIDGMWVDETIGHPIATPSFASMCECTARHEPGATA